MSNVSYINVNGHLYPFDDPQLTEEVENIRIGADGKQYGSAGDALRSQLADINGGLETAQNNITQIYGEQDGEKENVSQAQGDITTLQSDTSTLATDISNVNSDLAPAFSESTTYAIGDYCFYDGTLYVAVAEHTGAWNAADFETVSIGGELETANAETADAQEITQTVSERKMGALIDTVTGSIASFTPDATVPTVRGLTVNVEPVQDLHGYDNPWPAGGGKNLVDPNATIYKRYLRDAGNRSYYWTFSDDSASIAIKVEPETAYTLSRYLTSGGIYRCSTIRVASLPSENDTTDIQTYQNVRETTATAFGTTRTITTDSSATYVVIQFNGATIRDFVVNGQFEKSSSATDYAPYSNICPISGRDAVEVKHSGADMTNPTTYTIPLGQTVYGGTVDVINGVLTVDRAMRTFDGSGDEVWRLYSGNRFTVDVPDYTSPATSVVSTLLSNYLRPTYKGAQGVIKWIISGSDRGAHALMTNFGLSTVAEMRDYLAENPLEVSYPLATPITIDLTPIEISVLTGQANNIWADSGDVSVDYAADLKTYIDQKIAAAVAALS